jgi:hypothetical protein
MESSTKYNYQDTSRGQNQPSRAGEPLLAGYPVLRTAPVPDYAVLISDCDNSSIALATSKVLFMGPGVPDGRLEFLFKRIGDAIVACPTTAQAQKIQLTGQSDPCCVDIFRKMISIEYFDGVQYLQQDFEKVFTCDCDSEVTEANRVQALVDVITADGSAAVSATRSGSNIVLTSKVAGRPFRVLGVEGFISETQTQANIESFGTGQHLLEKGFDVSLLTLSSNYNIIAFQVEEPVEVNQGPFKPGQARPYMLVRKNVWVAFASGCSTLRTTLLGILNGTGTAAQYLDRVASDNCNNPTPTPTPSPSPSPSPSA